MKALHKTIIRAIHRSRTELDRTGPAWTEDRIIAT